MRLDGFRKGKVPLKKLDLSNSAVSRAGIGSLCEYLSREDCGLEWLSLYMNDVGVETITLIVDYSVCGMPSGNE